MHATWGIVRSLPSRAEGSATSCGLGWVKGAGQPACPTDDKGGITHQGSQAQQRQGL